MPTSIGLAAQGIDPTTGTPVGDYVVCQTLIDALLISQPVKTQTWGGGSDSYFEYLIKYARLTNTDDPLWTREWAAAVDSSIKVLSSVSLVFGHLYF